VIARLVAIAVALAGCGAEFLNVPLPAGCTRSRVDCRRELLQRVRRETAADDPALLAYVRGVVARLVRGSTLREPPDVLLDWRDPGEVVGNQIEIGVDVIAHFDSEAELAGILAHEIVHIETRCDVGCAAVGTDDESLADERAVLLLSRAGYPPGAFATALARLHDYGSEHDPDHLPVAERVARARLLAEQLPAGGDDRRGALLAALDGHRMDSTTLVFSDGGIIDYSSMRFYDADQTGSGAGPLDPSFPLFVMPERDIMFGAPNVVPGGSKGVWTVWPVGRAGAAAIGSMLVDTHRRKLSVGTAIIGRSPPAPGPFAPRSELADARQPALDDIAPIGNDEAVAVIDTAGGGVVVTYDGSGGTAMIERWLAWLRKATAAERAWRAHRIEIRSAPRTAPLHELVATCPDPDRAANVDSADRIVHIGERFKCVVR
jgi:hypothetical protein